VIRIFSAGRHLLRLPLLVKVACLSAAAPLILGADVPCDTPEVGAQEEPEVQIGVRQETRAGIRRYVYTVLNRSRDTLTTVQIGYDGERDVCELTGAPPHVLPDTAYSPPGWNCGPVQAKDPMTFAVGWRADSSAGTVGILPGALISGFVITLPRPDSLYERCHWRARIKKRYQMELASVGSLRPEGELDLITSDTGTISGRVTDDRSQGIPSVKIFVRGSDLGAVTRSDGTYKISRVPVGRNSFAARAVGFDPCDRAHVRVAADKATRVDFNLAAAPSVTPCVPYITAYERIELPFPTNAVDTNGARFLERRASIPARSADDTSKPQAFIYSLTKSEVSFVYRGLGQDTLRRAFVASVHRNARRSEMERLIRIAEETYPQPDAILPIAESRPGRQALQKEKRLWWYGEFDGVRLPYAVTMDAVRYYLGLVQAMGRGDSTQTKGIRMKRAEFSYHANISERPATYSRDGRVFNDVFVVELGLRWSNYCGLTCACFFHLDRTVVLRRDGTVLCVFGDQKPMVVVS